jgi:heptosyltransferase III
MPLRLAQQGWWLFTVRADFLCVARFIRIETKLSNYRYSNIILYCIKGMLWSCFGMNRLRRVLKCLVYLPIHPSGFKRLVQILRWVGWFPSRNGTSETIRRILVVQPHNSLGDLVLSVPFLDEVHRQWPKAEIDLIVGNAMTALFQHIPFVRRVIGYVPSSNEPPLARYQNVLRLFSLYRNEIRDRYDLALDPRWDSDGHAYLARAMAFLSDAHVRVAYSGAADGIDPSLDAFMTHCALGGRNEYESIRKLKMFQRAGLSTRAVVDSESFQVNATLSTLAPLGKRTLDASLLQAGMPIGERYCVLAPSASTAAKIWPIERLAKVAKILHAKYGLRFVVIGSSKDTQLCERTAASCSGIAISLAGKTNILELLALLTRASLFIGNDSGPAHLSSMIGTATVIAIVGRAPSEELDYINAPRRFRPWGPKVLLVQPDRPLPPCDPFCISQEAHCITQVSADAILAACEELLLANSSDSNPIKVSGEM